MAGRLPSRAMSCRTRAWERSPGLSREHYLCCLVVHRGFGQVVERLG